MNFTQEFFLGILPTVGVIVVAILGLRSGNKRIDDIGSDTKIILPKTENIEKYTEKTNDIITENVQVKIDSLVSNQSKLDFLFEEASYKKRLENEYAGVVQRDNVISSVDKLFEENAKLEAKILEYEIEKRELIEKANKYQKLYEDERTKNAKKTKRKIDF